MVWASGSVFLLPWISKILVWTLSNYIQDGKPVVASYWIEIMRSVVMILNSIMVVLQSCMMIILLINTSYFSQLIVGFSIIGSFLGAIFVTNIARVMANWLLPDRL